MTCCFARGDASRATQESGIGLRIVAVERYEDTVRPGVWRLRVVTGYLPEIGPRQASRSVTVG